MQADHSPLPIKSRRSFLGKDIGRFAYGCWRWPSLAPAETRTALEAALASGISVIDTAAIYGWGEGAAGETGFGIAEAQLGALLAETPSLRDDLTLITKGGIIPPEPYNSSSAHLVASCEASLKRLNTDHVDVFLIHRPDNLASHAEVAEALNEIVTSGKAKAVGVSNYSLEQTRALQHFVETPLAVTQPEISCWEVTTIFNGQLDHAQTSDMLPMAWSPLAGGALATAQVPVQGADRFDALIAKLDQLAEKNNTTRDIIALTWLLLHPSAIMPILGTNKPSRIKAAVAALDVKLSRQDWYNILEASLGQPMP